MSSLPTQPEFAGIEQVFNLTSGGPAPVTTAKPKKPKAERTVDAAALPPNLGKATRLPSVDFNDPNRPLTCLEVDFPIAPINALSKVEGNAGKPIYQMSKWWARRRSCIFRAILIAAGVKAPDDPEKAARLVWEYFYANHQKAGNFRGMKVLEPFMGGGTTLVEGARLGYHVIGNDLNPVAWMVVKNEVAGSDPEQVRAIFAEIERAVKPLIHPFYVTNCPGGHQGQWVDKRNGQPADVDPIDLETGHRKHYEWDGAEVIYTFWARHGPCMAEACGHLTPLFKTPVIAEKDLVTDYFELRCPKTGAVYHAELGETRLAPGCERVVLETEPRFVESTQEFARLFADYNSGNSDEKRQRIQRLLALVETEPALRHPDTGEWCGVGIKTTLERQQRASRASDLKKKDFNIRSRSVFMYLLLDPKWFDGSPGQVEGNELGGFAGAASDATERWYNERLKTLSIIEVRGRVRFADAPEPGEAPDASPKGEEDERKQYGLPPQITLAEGRTISTQKGPAPENGSFVCAKDGRKQEVVDALRHAEHTGPVMPILLQCFCPRRRDQGYTYDGRFFKIPTIEDIRRIVAADREWQIRSINDLAAFWPREELPYARRTFIKDVIPSHGYTHWWKFFNPRQLLVHSTIIKTIVELVEKGWARDLAIQALGGFQQYLRNQNMLAFYHRTRDCLAPTFGNPDYRTKNCSIEVSLSAKGYGTWRSTVSGIPDGLEYFINPWEPWLVSGEGSRKSVRLPLGEQPSQSEMEVVCGSSTELRALKDCSVDLCITDPPFGHNINYADLADFFYVWIRIPLLRILEGKPEANYFRPKFTPKSVEVIENEAEHPDDRTNEQRKERVDGSPNPNYQPPPAEDFYEKGLTLCWAEAFRVLKQGGLLAFTFHHDEDRAWANVLRSLFEAGFLLVATYPVIADETKGDNAQFGSQKIAYDVIHVCRKRLEKPVPVSWAKMRRWVREEASRLKTLLEHSHGQSLSDADLRVILRGKALEFYSRHYGQVWIGQEILGVKEALLGINQLLDDLLAEGVAAAQRPPEAADPVTRLFLRLFARRTSMPRDELHKNLKGTTVDTALLADRGWVRIVGTTVHAVPVAERFQFFTAPGRNRKIIRTDLDQAQFLAGAALPRSGFNIEAELDRETFNVKPSVDSLLDWVAQTDPSPDVRQAAVLAKNILANWRAKQAAERARRPEAAQLELLQVAQSEV